MRVVLAAGASPQQIEDAPAICFSFNVIVGWPMRSGSSYRVLKPSRQGQDTSSRAVIADKHAATSLNCCPSVSPDASMYVLKVFRSLARACTQPTLVRLCVRTFVRACVRGSGRSDGTTLL